MPYKYIGRTTDFKGKTLWEILGNLKNFGIGRIVARNRFQRYSEPCYNKILKTEVLQNPKPSYDEQRKVIVLVENIFRNLKNNQPVQIESASYKTDYFLVPKYKEYEFCKSFSYPIKIFPHSMELPPLLKEIILKEMSENTFNAEELKMKIVYNLTGFNKSYQVATKSEVPTEQFNIGLGSPIAPRLYENIV
ncbi:uncharacterized protein LOC131675035 [Phymastichus coffea]|uniref:uncharacterized protein LOC131675035 n=1 Tax=Phymastichus coffea TaxID=108790 RepID=UPI00273C6522|nr:uncharacterized protein LOC131675035 [Phymastichus coffea]